MTKKLIDLTAKICFLPFAEPGMYENDYISIWIQSLKSGSENAEKYLNRDLLPWLHQRLNSYQQLRNEDEVKLIFLKYFSNREMKNIFVNEGCAKGYCTLLSKIVKNLITHRNGKIAFKYWSGEGEVGFLGGYENFEKVELWHEINRHLSTDLLIAAYLVGNEMGESQLSVGSISVMMADVQLNELLSKGLAETHCHTGAGIEFCLSWRQLMNIRRNNRKDYGHKQMLNSLWMSNKEEWEKRVQGAAFSRLVMAEFLYRECGHSFRNHLCLYNELDINDDETETPNFIKELLDTIYKGGDINFYERSLFEQKFTQLREVLQIELLPIGEAGIDQDLLAYLPGYKGRKDAEMLFLIKALRYIQCEDSDAYFAKVFFQYVRVKNAVFQGKVQSGDVKGLEHFQKYYHRSTHLSMDGSKEYWRMILEQQLQNEYMRKLELRTGFGSGKSERGIRKQLKRKIRCFLQAYRDTSEAMVEQKVIKEVPLVGLVFHFTKRPDNRTINKCYFKKNRRGSNFYYEELRRTYFRQAKALKEMREQIKGLSNYVVGIDAASIEKDTDPWVFAPVYDVCRDSMKSKLIYDVDETQSIKTLGFTYHVGEDFRHLLTGLRHIDETLEHFKFHAGDRLGHAIALGIDVKKWVNNQGSVVMPRIEYMENLLWIWGFLKNNEGYFDSLWLEKEILICSKEIYKNIEGISTHKLWLAYQKKFKFIECLEQKDIECIDCRMAQRMKNSDIAWNEDDLYRAYHCTKYLESMLEPIQIIIRQEDANLIIKLQAVIIDKVNQRGIVIETNPTSNTLIGNAKGILEHHIVNYNNSDNVKLHPIPALVTINTDDPSVFNTNLNNEFAYVYYQLLHRNFRRGDVFEWIAKIRDYGMISSFIKDRPLDTRSVNAEVEEILKEL